MVHEYAHLRLGHSERRTTTTKTVRETEAEAVAFVVSKAIGLNPNSSASYIQLYHGNAELLMESLEVVQQTSAVILAAIEMEEPVPPEAQEPQIRARGNTGNPRCRLLARTGRYRRGSATSRLKHAHANWRGQARCVCPHNFHHYSDKKEKTIMATAVQVSNEYRNVPVTALVESTSNPRKRFDAKSLEELAASFKAQGVLQPLLVRTIEEDKYEVIAGARRLRAANLAALEEVPVRVVELSDAACVETQLVENIQRENVHPLEEAFAFYGLLHTDGLQYDINSLAAKAGKSPAFVATRLRLVELTPSIAEAFLADEIGVGHALEIAKLPQPEQQRAFDAAFHTVWNGGKETRILRPVRDLTAWIEQNILLSLDSVPFDKNDEALVPEAGSCANCPKRTGFNTLLFDAALQDSCTDKDCYNNKLTKNVERQIAEKPKLGADYERMESARKQRSAWTEPIRCIESLGQVCEIQEAALALSETMQAHERGHRGRRHRARAHGESLRRAELPGTLRRPPRSQPGADSQRTRTAPERTGATRSSKPRCGTARWPKCSSASAHRLTAPTLRWLRVLF